jgi:SAM-dependent methyltransferase
MRILFVTMAQVESGPAGPTSPIASTRYRVLMPAQQLDRLGHQVQIATLPPGPVPPGFLQVPCDVLVFSKSFRAEHEPLVEAVRSRGAKVVADYCDDHFDRPDIGPWYTRLAKTADVVVASTPAMAEAVRRHAGRDALVVTDPIEGRRGPPAFAPRLPRLRVLWFGNHNNLMSIVDRMGQVRELAAHVPLDFTVLTRAGPEVDNLVADLVKLDPARITGRVVPWSIEGTWKALEDCDLVWIPVIDGERYSVKSANRLVESVWAGRYVVADAMPTYDAYGDLVAVGRGLAKGVMDALADPASVEKRIGQAQRRVSREHSLFEVGRQWARALGDHTARPLRLNLGCGDKILPGYVNVDVVQSRAGMRPDVICDLHDLAPFDDASADEILSVHVVEHFWRWEIGDVLKEWVRVLKPGGRMIVECPNIASACETFLQDPVRHARADQAGQRTMWVFYGDPQWKDPLMIHRWGYTPESLKALLAEAGLAEVRQEPAQFKLREPRDMRVVGVKR